MANSIFQNGVCVVYPGRSVNAPEEVSRAELTGGTAQCAKPGLAMVAVGDLVAE